MPDTLDVALGEGDAAFPGVLAVPATLPLGGVVAVQEAFGITGHIRDICRRLADAGQGAGVHRLGGCFPGSIFAGSRPTL